LGDAIVVGSHKPQAKNSGNGWEKNSIGEMHQEAGTSNGKNQRESGQKRTPLSISKNGSKGGKRGVVLQKVVGGGDRGLGRFTAEGMGSEKAPAGKKKGINERVLRWKIGSLHRKNTRAGCKGGGLKVKGREGGKGG